VKVKWIAARNFAFGLVLALVIAAPLAAAERTVDVLVADDTQVEFTDTGFIAAYRSIATGQTVVTVVRILSATGTDPNVNEVTFDVLYSDGFRASGTGSTVVGSIPELTASAERPFPPFFVLGHHPITDTNQPRSGRWPRPGDQVLIAGELLKEGVFSGTLRIIRSD
jgi:hypothetical protein